MGSLTLLSFLQLSSLLVAGGILSFIASLRHCTEGLPGVAHIESPSVLPCNNFSLPSLPQIATHLWRLTLQMWCILLTEVPGSVSPSAMTNLPIYVSDPKTLISKEIFPAPNDSVNTVVLIRNFLVFNNISETSKIFQFCSTVIQRQIGFFFCSIKIKPHY